MHANDDPSRQPDDSPKEVTWEEARQMLHHVAVEWEPGGESEEEAQETLNRRTRLLARPAEDVTAPVDVRRVLAFALGAEHYAVPVTAVRAIAELRELTPVPCTPDYYVGVVNVRGKVISAIDLRLLFGIPVDAEQEGGQPPENIVVVEMAGLEISLLAHEVSGVTDLPAASLSLPSDALVGISPDYVAGTTAEGTILLDLETLLSDERMIVAEEVV